MLGKRTIPNPKIKATIKVLYGQDFEDIYGRNMPKKTESDHWFNLYIMPRIEMLSDRRRLAIELYKKKGEGYYKIIPISHEKGENRGFRKQIVVKITKIHNKLIKFKVKRDDEKV